MAALASAPARAGSAAAAGPRCAARAPVSTRSLNTSFLAGGSPSLRSTLGAKVSVRNEMPRSRSSKRALTGNSSPLDLDHLLLSNLR